MFFQFFFCHCIHGFNFVFQFVNIYRKDVITCDDVIKIIVIFMFGWGVSIYFKEVRIPNNAMEVFVVRCDTILILSYIS